ncbi:DUF4176 domain-containing protein [Streptococcus agalactiae]|uniref:DUF4176 domain-containing protein n=1 Tax=Streptococcus agalactiae TaxID=1311 RepID=UPI00053039DF|nr:DUF4176 domain-containing protein [Streptococcus agalactiae]AIX04794.1 hypothetical protein W903_1109 [Streptococcus agalactiae CNCTC 10/84]UXJ88563.1 DUF4176 domain-containing protein [Streptococcus agalactiae]UXJ90464.1 DUF4176 domain-containing protein [Streptococcus agalactiae]UXJ92365.1 DUF4176 domain-containing protein [Streptococcus agalactiae]WHU66206.1 DUF4176 domain-containing protein [Streptococcus agalactiae]
MVILNRASIVDQNGQEVYFDYLGGIFPEGLNMEQVYYFNEEDIDEVIFEGYHDEEEERFLKIYHEWEKKYLSLKVDKITLK